MFLREQSIFDARTGCNRYKFKYIKKCSCSKKDSKSKDDNAKKNIKRKYNSRKSIKVVSKLLIPEDLMFDILGFVPVHCLLNSARFVCKSWATTIHSSLFAEACLHRARSKPGFYVEHFDSSSSYFLDIINNVNGRFEFERTDLGIPRRMGMIVSSCDGILLLRHGYRDLFVVNPILKCWLKIPPVSISTECRVTMARVPHTTMFKLFFIDVLEVSGGFWYVFYVLRIGIDNSLKEITRKESPHEKQCLLKKPLYGGGNDVYYITTKGITVVDVDKEIIVGEYPLPPVKMCSYPQPIWLTMGDHLSCIVRKGYFDHNTYKIYILDFDSGKWSLYHKTRPLDYAIPFGHETRGETFCLWINDQIIFQVYIKEKEDIHSWKRSINFSKKKEDIYADDKSIHFSYNVKTRRLKKIEGITEEGVFRVWLHTNSLVSLPNIST
ncbi:F-box/kelch-repeat protein [Trifolium repens]|nr:F-box/kelch-repeat protein [Trifolium repens]